MGLFSFLAEVVSAPLDIASTTVKTTLRTAGAAVTLDGSKVLAEIDRGVDALDQKTEDVLAALEE